MWNDTDLQYHVEKELDWEPSVHANQIGVVVKDGTVQLIGHVDSFWEKCAAERTVWRVARKTRGIRNRSRLGDGATAASRPSAVLGTRRTPWRLRPCHLPLTLWACCASLSIASASELSHTAERPTA